MTCQDCLDALNDLLDGALTAARRREIEGHLQGCEACATVHADLARIRLLGSSLERLQPPVGVWERIEAETVPGRAGRNPAGAWWLRRAVWMPVAVAASLVLAVAIVYLVQQQWAGRSAEADPPTTSATSVGDHPELQSVATQLQLAEQHYENAIRGLERLANDRQVLDPEVAAALQKNLQVIDQAIDESRAALRDQPMSEQAQLSLFEAFRTKIVVLQETLALINEMRKGNQAEAARLADSLNKS
jgi:hypothetical protein